MRMVICPGCNSLMPETNLYCLRCNRSLRGAPLAPNGALGRSGPRSRAKQISIFTDIHQIVGTLDLPVERLTDALTQEAFDLLRLKDCLISSLGDQAGNEYLAPEVQLRRPHVLFAVDHQDVIAPREDGPPADRMMRQARRIRKKTWSIGAIIGGWEVTGLMHLSPDATPTLTPLALEARRSTFLPLTEAHANFPANAKFRLGPATLIVHWEKITGLWLVQQPDAAAV
jgi:hypothetical protein